uniref:Viral A-type inclusion protein n=1 Tax=Romanomermis culicivorax TaxID=13658 RepID=A0A915HYJ1_ROMCU
MNTDIFINRVEKYCEALLVLSPKVEVDDQNMDLKSKQSHLQLKKRMAWCAFLKNLDEQKKLCQNDYSKCETVKEIMPGGITMNIWESKTRDQNFSQERLLQKLANIEQQQQEIKTKMRDQENQRNRENGRLDKLIDERSKSNKLKLQKRLTDSRSRTKLISEAKSKLNILLVILKGLDKESEKMTQKQIECESKLKKLFDQQNQMLEYRSIIDYVSESLLEHRKLITEIENVAENVNNSILEISTKHENPETGGQEIGQQTWSTFIYYLQEASNTIKFFNQNHQMIHSETENRIKNFRAKDIVQNMYQFVYDKTKMNCEDCPPSASTVTDQNKD